MANCMQRAFVIYMMLISSIVDEQLPIVDTSRLEELNLIERLP
jgi:hypothetical protein